MPMASVLIQATTLIGNLLIKNRIIVITVIIMAIVLEVILFPLFYITFFRPIYYLFPAVRILIPSLTGFPPIFTLFKLLNYKRIRRVKGILALCKPLYADIIIHINPRQIHQTEWSHGIAQPLLTGRVNIIHGCHPFFQKRKRLMHYGGIDSAVSYTHLDVYKRQDLMRSI